MGEKWFFFTRDYTEAGKDKYITIGEGFRVDGGTKESHKEAVAITEEVQRRVQADSPETGRDMARILDESVKKVRIPPSRE